MPNPFPTWSFQVRVGLTSACAAAYALAFLALYPMMSSAAGALSIFPVTLAGWLLGRRGGISGGLLVGVINILLYSLVEGFGSSLLTRGVPVTAVFTAAGALVGWLSELALTVTTQSSQLDGERAALTAEIAARAGTESALGEARRSLATLISSLPGMAYRCRNDQEWTVEFASEGCLALTGYRPSDLVDNQTVSYAQLIHPDDREEVWSDVQSALGERRAFTLEYRIITATGEEKWVWEQGQGVFSPDGHLLALEGFITDITPQKLAEKSRRESEERLKAQYRSIPVPTYTWRKLGEEFQLVDCNDAAKAYTRGHVDDLLGRAAGELYADAPEILADLARCFNERTTIRQEMRYRLRSTGETREMIAHYVYVPPDGVMIYTEDVADRKRAEDEIRLLQSVTWAVSEAHDLQTALEATLRTVCDATGWLLGQAWVPRSDGTALECHPAWYCGENEVTRLGPFRSACERFLFRPGVGLIGRVWASKAPVWLTDVESDSDFLRVLPVREAGLEAAMGIPVLAGEEVVAVLEFFVPEPREEDGRLVQLVSVVAAQLGTLILRKQTENELTRWGQVFEHAEWGILIGESDSNTIARLNPALARMHGYTVDELLGKPVVSLCAPERREGYKERVQEITAQGHAGFECLHVRKDGSVFPVWVEVTVIKDERGRPLYRSTNIRDITGRKRGEEELRESEERFRALSEATVEGVAILEDGRVIEVNRTLARLLGCEPEELMGKSVFELTAPESREGVLRKLVAPDDRAHEAIGLRKDGSRFPVSLRSRKSHYRGRPVRIVILRDLTRRKQVAEKLQRGAAMLAEAQRLAHLGSWERDVETNEMTWSNEMYRILGLKPTEVAPTVGLFLARIHPLDRDAVAAKIQAVRRDPRPGEYHCRVIRGDGAERIIHMRGDVVCDASGRLVRTFGTIQDVTELKRAEEALRQTAKMLAEAERVAQLGSWERDCGTDTGVWSDGLYQLLGLQPRQFPASREAFLERVHPEDREEFLSFMERRSRGSGQDVFDFRVIRADGVERIFQARAEPVIDQAGQLLKRFGTFQDVTELRQTEEALKRTAAMLAKAEQIARLGSWDRDFQANTLVWSDEFYRLLGSEAQAFPASREAFVERVHPDDRELFMSFLEETDRGSRPDIIDCRVIRGDGVERIFQTRAEATVDAEGRPLRRVGTVQDVTELRRAETEVQRHREVLAQTEKLAAMGQLLAGVAHELNNPLAVVVGQADLLQAIVGEGDLGKRAAEIARAAQRCASIVKNFLALARQHPPERAAVALNQVLQESVDMLAYHLNVDNVEVALDLAGDVPELWADPSHLSQVVINLVCNAHQALLDGPLPRRLTVTSRFEPLERRVWFEIADTGPGIAPEILPRVFEPFFTTKPTGKGTGLGLSLCQGIVERHGGVIEARSEPGQGAAFRVTFPLGAPAESGDGQEPDEEVQAGDPGTILVVEDEPGIAQILVELLSADGHRVECAESGALALEKLQSRRYDVILSDIRMPDLDGPMLYRELERRHPELCERVIFLTGDVLGPDTGEFLARTGRPSLGKPFSSRAVVRAVRSVLTASREVERLMERLSEVLEAQGFVEHHRRSQLKA